MSEPSEPIPLQPEDRAILDLECETIAGHTCKVIRLGAGAPDLEELRLRVEARVERTPELSRRLGGGGGEPAWVAWEGFDVEQRVRPLEPERPLTDAEIPSQVAGLFEQRLDRERPLWQIHHARTDDGGAVLIWRIHHALADGTASMRFARELLFDEEPASPARAPEGGKGPVAVKSHSDDLRRRRHLAAFIEREYGESLHRSPFDGTIGTKRRVAFGTVELKPLHDAAKRICGATLNDAVLSVVSGSLRLWLEHHHGSLRAVRVRVPVSLHHEGDELANHDSFFSLRLPLNEPDPVKRLRTVHAATAIRKADHDAEARDALLRGLASSSPRLAVLAQRIESSPRNFALSVSNVPGPREPVEVLGAPVESVHSLAEIGRHHALRVAVVSLAGSLHFGFCADPAIVDDLAAMGRGVESEAAALVAAS